MDTNVKELLMALGSALDGESQDRNNKMEEVLKEMKEIKVLVHEWHVKDKGQLTEKLKNKTDECTAAQKQVENLQQQVEQLQTSIQKLKDEHDTTVQGLKEKHDATVQALQRGHDMAYQQLKTSYEEVQNVQHQLKLQQLQTEIDRLNGELERQKTDYDKKISDQETELQAEIKKLEDQKAQQEKILTDRMVERESELQTEIHTLKTQADEQKDDFNKQISAQETKLRQEFAQQESVLQKEKESAESKRDAMLKDLGSSYNDEFADLYRRFKESPWAQTDTAMRNLFAEDYPTFFALCGSEVVVKKFHKNLQSIVLRAEKDYLELADKLLDFCVAACSAVNKASYSRQAAANGESYSLNNHVLCGRREGDKIHVILHGIQKNEQLFLGSFVTVGNGDEA